MAALPYWILLLVMAGTGYLQSSQMMTRNPNAAQNPQMRLMKYLPLLFVVFFIRFPAGVLLYYAMSNVCRIVQQDAMYRFDPKVKALVAQEVREVEAHTHEIDEEQARGKKRPKASGGQTSGTNLRRGRNPRGPNRPDQPPASGNLLDGGTTGRWQPAPGWGRRRLDRWRVGPDTRRAGSIPGLWPRQPTAAEASGAGETGPTGTGSEPGTGAGAPPRRKHSQPGAARTRDRRQAPAGQRKGARPANAPHGKPAGRPPSPTGKPPPKGGHRTNRKRRR